MQRFEWSQQGLVAKLSENLVPIHPAKKSPTPPHTHSLGGRGVRMADTAPTHVQMSADIVKEPHSNPSIWKSVHMLKSDLRSKVGRTLAYLCIQINKSLLDFASDGGIILKGTQIAGTNIVKILVSALTAIEDFEIGEMLILSLLQHCPRNILKLIQSSKLTFIKDEEREDEFEPIMQQHETKSNGQQPAIKTKHTKFNPQMVATYVPKKAKISTFPKVVDSAIKNTDMRTRKWFDLSS
jgi:hypothetical protein